ncbi:MAG: prephenate dehydrogenase/arogenate dehydrogenase family protein [Dehalococcoidia bacterium]
MARIAIIGLGLIGGSLGLAIKAANRKGVEIVGSDEHGRVRKQARNLGAVDDTQSDPRKAVEGAGLVIIATPPVATAEVFQTIAPALAKGAAVTDVASTKRQIMEWAREYLPTYVSFVGGHPMAGKTDQGIANAEAGLFQGRPYAVVPSTNAGEDAVRSVLGMVQTIGAKERFMTADEHDEYVGAVSHLPLLSSLTLFSMLRQSDSWADFGKIAGPAFSDLTRLVSGDPQMSTDIAITNRERVQYWLDRYILELKRTRDLLDGPAEDIYKEFAEAQVNHARFLAGEDLDDLPRLEPPPDGGAQMAALLISPKIYDRLRGIIKRMEEPAEQPGQRR